METLDDYIMTRPPTAARPLLGVTVLVVEDSRFASDALRLMCLRSGARIRRADSLDHARRHLRVYRPTCCIVDLGLPDGRGEELLTELSRTSPPIEVLIAISGDADREEAALAAGAHGFVAKPVPSLAAFQNLILSFLPPERQPRGPRPAEAGQVVPDPLALRDDLAAVADSLRNGTDMEYVTQFLSGVASSARDSAMTRAVDALKTARARGTPCGPEIAQLSALVTSRLAEPAPI